MHGNIKVKEVKLPGDAIRLEYELVGTPPYRATRAILQIALQRESLPLEVGKSFWVGGYRMRNVYYNWLHDEYELAPVALTARFGHRIERGRRFVDNLYRRFILALESRGLAEVDRNVNYVLPSWRDVRIFKRK